VKCTSKKYLVTVHARGCLSSCSCAGTLASFAYKECEVRVSVLAWLFVAWGLSEEGVRLGGRKRPVGAGGSKEGCQLVTRQDDRKPDSFGRPDSTTVATSLSHALAVTD
jgi:hypothetical protein